MTELTKLEVGKTYVFKDEQSKQDYLENYTGDISKLKSCYDDGFTLTRVNSNGSGFTGGWNVITRCVINKNNIKYFKTKGGKCCDK